MENLDLNPPERENEDYIHQLVRTLLSTLSIGYSVGNGDISITTKAPLAELFGLLVQPSIEKRIGKWRINMVKAIRHILQELEGLSINNLQEDDEFISLIYNLTLNAAKVHQDEKLILLGNVLCNSYLEKEIEFELRLVAGRLAQELSATQVILLQEIFSESEDIKLIDNFNDLFYWMRKKTNYPLKTNYTEFVFYVMDLQNRGLLDISDHMISNSSLARDTVSLAANNDYNPDSPYILVTGMGRYFIELIREYGSRGQ
ncbi:hypothetical protein [Lewinella sp. LCG006]|uniref:hypothetical protein n=1 Tax=Lewinella sp. LCG006 TaxID=3231911 RepID=UPI0034614DD8